MTTEELATLTPEQKRIRIALLIGPWKFAPEDNYVVIKEGDCTRMRYFPNSNPDEIRDRLNLAGVPDYLNDLNACHEMEKVLTPEQRRDYVLELATHGAFDTQSACFATAAQRCDAFLLTI